MKSCRIEDNADREQQLIKLSKIRETYQKIVEIASEECLIASKKPHFKSQLFQKLSKLAILFFFSLLKEEKNGI